MPGPLTGKRRWLRWLLAAAALAGIASGWLIETINIAPRLLAPYIERRSSGHHPLIVQTGQQLGQILRSADRGARGADGGAPLVPASYPTWIGTGSDSAATPAPSDNTSARIVWVNAAEQARTAIQNARPGDVITFLPGRYRFYGSAIPAEASGRADAPIVVRAAQPGTVTLELATEEGFWIKGAHWQFENLTIRGICPSDADCEHAFHVVANAHHFVARNNTITDFNAHFKINGVAGRFPDHGQITGNRLSNSRPRNTERSVTLIDLVAASAWRIEKNLIADFVKQDGDQTSYGVFVKGGGHGNRISSNVILCTHRLRNQPGRQVGASLGGGGTGKKFCRDHKCIVEQEDSVISNNLIAACADDGIYLNRAARSRVSHNTLLDTAGISIRFPETSADLSGNLIDGTIRLRDGAVIHDADNQSSWMTSLYLGVHSVRQLFIDAAVLDLHWNSSPPRRTAATPAVDEATDLCGSPRPAQPAYGAFEDFSACLQR